MKTITEKEMLSLFHETDTKNAQDLNQQIIEHHDFHYVDANGPNTPELLQGYYEKETIEEALTYHERQLEITHQAITICLMLEDYLESAIATHQNQHAQ